MQIIAETHIIFCQLIKSDKNICISQILFLYLCKKNKDALLNVFIIMEKSQHVQVPDPDKEKRELKPIDYLVYANIRRFMNKDTKCC